MLLCGAHLRLMLAPSIIRWPMFLVFAARSEPAKSISDSLATWTPSQSRDNVTICSTNFNSFNSILLGSLMQ
jgi:hypothetical protein